MYTIITNNSLLSSATIETQNAIYTLEKTTGELDAIYAAVMHKLQNGHKLVSSPLPANVPLIRSPIRSIILKHHAKQYDKDGLLMLIKAQERTKTLGITNNPELRNDLEIIDADQLKRALNQLEMIEGMTTESLLQNS